MPSLQAVAVPDLWVVPTDSDDVIVVAAVGELDFGSGADVLVQLVGLIDVIDPQPRLVVVDASRLTFIDCAGLTTLLRAHEHALLRGQRLVLVPPTTAVRRLLRLTNVGGHLRSYDTVADAVRDVSALPARLAPPLIRDAASPVPRRRPPDESLYVAPL